MKNADKNFVSVWFWLFASVLMIVPVVNVVLAIIWALVGENQSRKNYFRAMIVIHLFCLTLMVLVLAFGLHKWL